MKAPVGLLSRRPVCKANAACLARQGRSDFDALDPTGCGTLRLLRALGGTRILQAAAPTAPPCIRRWRRSSPLHFFLASPICRPLSRCGGSSPQGSGCALSVCSRWSHPPLPLGELANPKGLTERAKGSPFGRAGAKRLRGFAPPLTRMLPAGSQRLQLPFAVTTPSREKENLKNPQIFQILKIKIIFPLKMPRVKRRAFQIVRRLKGSPCKTKPFP